MKIRDILSETRLYLCNHCVSHIPSHAFRLTVYRKMMGFEIGRDSSVFLGAWFYCAGGLQIGDESVLNENCCIDTRGQVQIGDRVVLAAKVVILTADHDPKDSAFKKDRQRKVIINNYAFVSTGALILPGVTLGEGCMVGAYSVVTKDVSPYMVVAGNPARIIGERPRDLSYSTTYRRLFQ